MTRLHNCFGYKMLMGYNCHGQGMAEMALVLPFLAIFIFAVMDFSQFAGRHHRVSTLSREAANLAFKTCVRNLPTMPGLGADPFNAPYDGFYNECVEYVRGEITKYAALTIPDFEARGAVIVSLYGKPMMMATPERYALSSEVNGFHTKASVPPSLLTTDGHEAVAFGEVFYHQEWNTPLKKLLTMLFPEEIYEASIV